MMLQTKTFVEVCIYDVKPNKTEQFEQLIEHDKPMYIIIWEYQVKADHVAEFESIYASNGAWTELFKKHSGYLGTELLRDSSYPLRYITIDRWISLEAHNSFQAKWQHEYKALDAHCRNLTDHESLLGSFSPVQPGG